MSYRELSEQPHGRLIPEPKYGTSDQGTLVEGVGSADIRKLGPAASQQGSVGLPCPNEESRVLRFRCVACLEEADIATASTQSETSVSKMSYQEMMWSSTGPLTASLATVDKNVGPQRGTLLQCPSQMACRLFETVVTIGSSDETVQRVMWFRMATTLNTMWISAVLHIQHLSLIHI